MKNTVKALELIILIVVMIGFLVIFISEVSSAWDAYRVLLETKDPNTDIEPEIEEEARKDNKKSEAKLYIATAISAFMTAFFANKMGVELPAPEEPIIEKVGEEEKEEKSLAEKITAMLVAAKKKIKNLIVNFDNTKVSVGSLYLIVYFIIALIAIITWASIPDQTPAVVKNVASISVTMFIGIAKTVLDTIPD